MLHTRIYFLLLQSTTPRVLESVCREIGRELSGGEKAAGGGNRAAAGFRFDGIP